MCSSIGVQIVVERALLIFEGEVRNRYCIAHVLYLYQEWLGIMWIPRSVCLVADGSRLGEPAKECLLSALYCPQSQIADVGNLQVFIL